MNVSQQTTVGYLFDSFRFCIYAVKPSETYYETFKEAPNMIAKAVPALLMMVLLEFLIKSIKGKKDVWRIHDAVINASCGALTEACKHFILRGAELSVYIWVYNHYRFFSLPWDSPYTYICAIIGVDLGYYWWHRASHEISLMWAAHYVHHSSQYCNVTTSMRTSVTMRPVMWLWFMHLAFLGLPPVTFMIHMQLALLYPALSHSDCVPKLNKVIPVFGQMIEFVMVTPSHHRVHHGANPYCIDRNYGQILIIWDRMFGTYAEEREDEELCFGTIENKPVNHMIYVQFHSWVDLWKRVQSMKTFGDKMRVLFYGPGWQPGKPRLGDPKDLPDVRGRPKNELNLPTWLNIYVAWHVALVFYSYFEMMGRLQILETGVPEMNLAYIILSFTSLGGIYDTHRYTIFLEPARLIYYLFLLKFYPIVGSTSVATYLTRNHYVSLLLCIPIVYHLLKQSRAVDRTSKHYKEELRREKAKAG